VAKRPYSPPQLVDYGKLATITLGSGGTNGDGGSTHNMAASDVDLKENILAVVWEKAHPVPE
jgi:hypothetical protein